MVLTRFAEYAGRTGAWWWLSVAAVAVAQCAPDRAGGPDGGGGRSTDKLAFAAQPSPAWAGEVMRQIIVSVEDSLGNEVERATDSVTLALGANPSGAKLSGQTTLLVDWGAGFESLRIDKPGAGYTLVASARGLGSDTSAPFDIIGPFMTVTAGMENSCGTTALGTYCWPLNGSGFAPVSGGLAFAGVSAGESHTCGVTAAGAAYCWGDNSAGQLGNDRVMADGCWSGLHGSLSCGTPVPVFGGHSFTTVSAGWLNTCGLTTEGAVYCWGAGTGPLQGLQADNVNCEMLDYWGSFCKRPVLVSGGLTFKTFSSSGEHICALTADGAAYCWGADASGQLGNGSTEFSSSPVRVSGELSWASVTVGYGLSCGVTVDGAAYCWGDNRFGQLGNGSTVGSTTPVRVSGGLGWTEVSAGDQNSHTCGIAASGAAYCWGNTAYGQLGNGLATNGSCGVSQGQSYCASPMKVSGGLVFATLSSGLGNPIYFMAHTCGVTVAGVPYCWGSNYSGELGVQNSDCYLTVPPVASCSTVPVRVEPSGWHAAGTAGPSRSSSTHFAH